MTRADFNSNYIKNINYFKLIVKLTRNRNEENSMLQHNNTGCKNGI